LNYEEKALMSGVGVFALGVGAALTARAIAPTLGRWARPVVRGAVKQGIILSQGTQVRAAGLREDLEDLVAEAREEVRQRGQNDPAGPSRTDSRTGGAQAA
jgi:hypothetical protein